MDIVVVDDLYRRPLGKPYLTLAWVEADAEALSRAYSNGSTELLTEFVAFADRPRMSELAAAPS